MKTNTVYYSIYERVGSDFCYGNFQFEIVLLVFQLQISWL